MSELQPPDGASRQQSFSRFAWCVVAYNVAVILWGALVRATGSGAGCGNHWPLCDGAAVPALASLHQKIEFTHRAMTGIDTPLIILLLIWAFRAFPKFHAVRRAATLSGVFLVSEALLGALLVKLQHVAKDADIYTMSTHLINTLTLLACLTLTAWWATHPQRARLQGKSMAMVAISLASVVILGITGAIAALGDTLYPAASLAAGVAQDFDPASNSLLRLRALHPLIACMVGMWLAVYAVKRLNTARTPAMSVMILVGVQIVAGLMNWLLQAPVWMQIVHLLIADLLWISLVVLCAEREG